MRKAVLMTLPLLLMTGFAFSQPGVAGSVADKKTNIIGPGMIVTGAVVDSRGYPMEGVSVRIVSTRASTATDVNGEYRIYAASDTSTLIAEPAGFWPKTEPINGRSRVNITFELPPVEMGVFRFLRNGDQSVALNKR